MANVWEITPKEVEYLQGSDGGPFRDFVNKIIRAQAATCNIAQAAIATDSRNAQDGGVDCEVKEAAIKDASGHLSDKTCWQYKATEHGRITETILREEIQKAYAKQLIAAGYGYRFCIADSVTAEKQAEWENILFEEAKKIYANAPRPQVLTSSALANWANQFPAIVASFIPVEKFFHLETWGKSVTRATKTYVDVPLWTDVANQIRQHVDFSNTVGALVFPVHADAGVGKTRLVYETVSQIAAVRSLLLYTSDDESAENVAHFLARSDRVALLVFDECSQQARARIEQYLRGNEHRVRVITIANYARTTINPEPTLAHMPDEIVDKILQENFPHVSPERRRAAVSMAGGFVKIAADICEHDIAGGLSSAEEYYQLRIPDEEDRKVIEAISLVKKVGFSGDVATEFEELCKLIGLSADDAKRRAKRIKESPGFVAIGGRYFYVTPEAIAQIALRNAWMHWIEDNPAEFFKRVSEPLLDTFQTRVAQSGTEDFRTAMACYFNDWSSKLTSADLVDKKKVERLVALIDTDPVRFLPVMVRLVEQASPDQLLGNTGYWTDGWGPRRALVWMCERLSAFPEFFYDVERILVRLAEHESEKGIGNNASAIWKHLFSLLLSGTSVPYVERLQLLAKRIISSSAHEAELALDALTEIFSTHHSRMVGPPVVAGRIPPRDWAPKTHNEYMQCLNEAFTLFERVIETGPPRLKEKALESISKRVGWFLRHCLLSEVRRLLAKPRLSVERLANILEEIDLFIRLEKQPDSNKSSTFPQKYFDDVLAWRKSLTPTNFHEKLVSVVARRPFYYLDEKNGAELRDEVAEIAAECHANISLLQQEMDWLTSAQATGAGDLGIELGRLDSRGTLFQTAVVKHTVPNLALSRGYLFGLVRNNPSQVSVVNSFLDELETANVELAFDYSSTIPKETDSFARWVRLHDRGKLPAHFVGALIYRLPEELSPKHLKEALPRLLHAPSSETRAGGIALNLVHSWIYQVAKKSEALEPKDRELWTLISEVLAKVVPDETMEVYYWAEVLKVYSTINPNIATRIASRALVEDFSVAEAAEQVLHLLAEKHPSLVMRTLGKQLLDSANAWKLQLRGCTGLITSLPPDVVMKWLETVDVRGARKVAASLPRPFINEGGDAVVPPLTHMVLERFGADEKVRRAFISGAGVRSYSGDIAGQHLKEAATAARFLQHPLAAIREWARIEKLSSEQEAERWRQEDAERFI